jgi:hypothetical protein
MCLQLPIFLLLEKCWEISVQITGKQNAQLLALLMHASVCLDSFSNLNIIANSFNRRVCRKQLRFVSERQNIRLEIVETLALLSHGQRVFCE